MSDDAEHKFVCTACGARLPFDSDMDSLECEFCRTISSNPAYVLRTRRSLRPKLTARDGAIEALANLGYGRPEAAAAIEKCLVQLGPDAETAALIRRGLRALSG